MPSISHGRYRGGSQFCRTSPVAVAVYTEENHSRFFNEAKFVGAQAALVATNARKVTMQDLVVEAARVARTREAELLGLTLKALRALARAAKVVGRSKLNKADLAHRLAFTA